MGELAQRYGIFTTTDNLALMERSEILVLAVKPQILRRVLEQIRERVRTDALIISIAAGVPIRAITDRLPPGARVVRTMPNMPALVDAGATAIAGGTHATPADLQAARSIFDAVGVSVVLDETLLDAVTGLSGSGPAYIFLILEALGLPLERIWSLHSAPTGISELEFRDDWTALHRMNTLVHLDAVPAGR